MHATESICIAKILMRDSTQVEARERVAKAKARRLQISSVAATSDDEDGQVPPMLLRVGLKNPDTFCIGILNIGTDVNVMYEEVYKDLGIVPKLGTSCILSSFTNKDNSYGAVVSVPLYRDTKQYVSSTYWNPILVRMTSFLKENGCANTGVLLIGTTLQLF